MIPSFELRAGWAPERAYGPAARSGGSLHARDVHFAGGGRKPFLPGPPADLRRHRRRRGFTLLEILLVLALLGLLVGVLVSGAVRLTDDKPATAEDVFWKAVQETRRHALLENKEVRLSFSAKSKERPPELIAVASDGTVKRHAFEIGSDVAVDFLSTQKARSASLHASQLVETNTMPGVTFYGDGTCTPFRVQFRTGGAARQMNIDPWTCAPVLAADESKRGGGR